MSENKDEVKIQIKTLLDSVGAVEAKKVIKEIQQETEKAGAKGKGAFDRFRESISGTASAAKVLRTVLGGLGVIALISQIGSLIGKIGEAVNAKRRMSAEIQAQNDAAAVAKTAEAYDKLREGIAKSNDELKNANTL
ncbi:MAG: hypothetical protein FWG50_13400 [Kiritimatiellaeota bacterium]|nr:hypothetical protein [Kiritimatiellota bacterium]